MRDYDHEAASEFAMFGGYGDWYFQTPEEQEQALKDRLALPSSGEEAQEAKARIRKRIALRKLQNRRGRLHET